MQANKPLYVSSAINFESSQPSSSSLIRLNLETELSGLVNAVVAIILLSFK